MPSQPGSSLAFVLLATVACGCCSVTEVARGRPGSDFEVSIPMSATRMAITAKRAPPPSTGEKGLMALLHPDVAIAQAKGGNIAHPKGDPGPDATMQLSKKKLQGEVHGILHAARDRQYRSAAQLLVSDERSVDRLEKYFEAYFEAYFRKFDFIDGAGGTFTASETFFYNRAGQKFGFPTVTVAINPAASKPIEVTQIDEVALIGDLTRVAIEAAGDAFSPDVPADAKSTLCQTKDLATPQCVAATDERRLKQLKCVVNYADKTEAFTGTIAAQVVRGGWWVALNNEALAKAFQVALSVSFRKAAEAGVVREGLCPPGGESTARVTEIQKVRVILVD